MDIDYPIGKSKGIEKVVLNYLHLEWDIGKNFGRLNFPCNVIEIGLKVFVPIN
jgi:hypothetical protein